MSDAPVPTPPEAFAASSTPSKRPWTILGRLSQAVREQNWFAVGLEVLTVVLGVVIGFQVTGWGQARADQAREQAYLHQLVQDLHSTQREFERIEPDLARRDSSAALIVRSFRTRERPSMDSVHVWVQWASRLDRPSIVTGTAVALVETGDINLIRGDSLRSAITSYIDQMALAAHWMDANAERASSHVEALSERLDFGETYVLGVSPEERALRARTEPLFPIPENPERSPFPLDSEALFQDRAAYTALWNIWRRRYLMSLNRRFALRATATLLEQIEAELSR